MNSLFVKNHLLKITIGMYSALFLFLMLTDPNKLPVLFVIAPVAWFFMCMSLSIYILLQKLNRSIDGQGKRNVAYSVSFSAMLCMIILLRSVNQLNGRDLLLVVVFLAIASFYAAKLRISTKTNN